MLLAADIVALKRAVWPSVVAVVVAVLGEESTPSVVATVVVGPW